MMDKQKIQVMVIDDEVIVCKRLKAALEKKGYEVEIFESSKAAMDRYEEKHFDVIVSDIRMDDIDGLDVLERVQSSSNPTKVILITGYATVEIARAALAKGAFDCIAKPFKPNELRDVIDRAVQALESA